MSIDHNIAVVLAHSVLFETKLELVPAGVVDNARCSIVSGTTGAILGADAQRHAANVNADIARQTNEANKRMFDESRGSTGSAVLPTYLKTAEGDPFEAQLGKDLQDIWNTTKETGPSITDLTTANAPYAQMQSQAANEAGKIFSGEKGDELLSNLRPVQAARQKSVTFKRAAAIDALNKTLADIEAKQSAQGFRSDSLGSRLLSFKANKTAADEGAAAQSGVDIQNATDERAVRDQNAMLPIQNLSLPYSMAQQEINSRLLPANAFLDQTARRLQPFNFMRIGTQPFQYTPMPTVQPQAGPFQLLAQQMAQTGNTAAGYFAKQQQAQQYQDALSKLGYRQNLNNMGAGYGGGGVLNNGGYVGDIYGGGYGAGAMGVNDVALDPDFMGAFAA